MRFCLALALSLLSHVALAEELASLKLASQVTVSSILHDFGGLSAIALHENGRRALVLSDRGSVFDLAIGRDAAGQMTRGIALGLRRLLIYEPGISIDSEGLERAADGTILVSTEHGAEVLEYSPGRHWPEHLPKPGLPYRADNRELEALARDAQGRVVVIPEAPLKGENRFSVWRLEDGTWMQVGDWARSGTFLVVGADFGPDGQLYILERAVSLLGFRSRIRRMDLENTPRDAPILYQSRLGQFDNLEGIDVWRDPAGQTRITLVSDDNFSPLQRTELVEFTLNE